MFQCCKNTQDNFLLATHEKGVKTFDILRPTFTFLNTHVNARKEIIENYSRNYWLKIAHSYIVYDCSKHFLINEGQFYIQFEHNTNV
jgi:hypothetical protein